MSKTAWDALKKQLQSGAFDDYEGERMRSLSVDKDEEAKRRYREYVQQQMLSEQQDDIVRRQLEQAQTGAPASDALRSPINITAGAAVNPHEPTQNAPEIDLRSANASRTQRAVERIKNEADQEYNLWTKLGLKKSEDLGTQANDIKVENYIPESVKNNDRNTLNQLDQKINRGRTLTPDEEVQYSEAKLREYYKQYPGLEKLMTERNDYFSASNAISNGYESGSRAYRAYADNKRKLVEDQIKNLTGWSDEELNSVLMYANRSKNREDTLAESKQFEVDPNASRVDQLLKSAQNTAYGLAVNRGTTNFGAWLDNRYSERPRGFGADIDSSAYRTINNANAATAEARKAIGRDVAKMGYAVGGEDLGTKMGKGATWLYDTAYSSGDSMINQIPAIVTQTVASKFVGEKAGEVIGNAVGLVPYYFKSYNQGYAEARQKGATEEEANFSGITSGAIEVLTEILPMSNYIANKMGKNAAKGFVKTFVKQGIEEGMEELIGTLAEEAVDAFIYKDDSEVKSRFEQRMQETGSFAGAVGDLTLEMLSSFFSGALSAAPSSAGTQAMGVRNYGKMQQNIRENASQIAQSIEGNTDYEKSVKAQMEQYAQNPTRYIADNLAENTDEDRQRKAEVLELAKKEANGEELTANEKLIIEEAMRESEESNKKQAEIDKKEGKTETKEDESKIPLEYRNKVSNLTEDEAREMLGKAANSGDADAFIDAMQMTMNSSHKSVSENATQIIGDYTGLAQDHGITAQAIGQARRSRLEAYKAGLNGEELTDLSEKNQMAYNEGKKEAILSKTRTTIAEGVLQNAKVQKNDGSTVGLKGVFTEDGIKTADGSTVKFEDIDKSDIRDSAVLKAYANADQFKNVNAKNAYLSNIKAGANIDAYDETFHKMYDSALAGVSYENAKKSFTEADEDVLKAAYQVGETERKEKAFSTMRGALGFAARKGSGKVSIETDALTAEEANYASILARTMGVDIRVIDAMSNAKTRGSFDVDNSVITVEASEFKESLSHEMSEFMESYNKKGYDALKNAIANFSSERMGNDAYIGLVQHYSTQFEAAYKESNIKNTDVSADEMSGEMFNDIAFQILGSKKGQKAFAEYLASHYEADEAKSIGQQLADRVKALAKTIKNVFNTADSKSPYAKEMSKYSEELGEFADQFIEALDTAIKNYKESAKIEAEEKLDEVSVMNGDTRAFSVKTYETDGRDMLEDYLKNYSGLSKKDQKDILTSLDWGYETAKKLAKDNKYASFGDWSETELTVAPDGTPMITVMGSNGKPLQSVAVSNGEYPLNIDFTQVCKKRIALNTVLNKLVSDADLNIRMLTESDVAGINRLIKEHGFEIACGLCFVDSKRYRVGSWATSFTDGKTDEDGVHSYGWNELVNSMLKKGVSADYFNLAAVHTDPLGTHLSQVDDKNINFKLIDKITKPYIKTDKNGNQVIGQTKINGQTANPTEEVRMAWLLKTNPESRHLLDHNDIIASEGLDKLRIENPDVYALVNSHGGTSKPKLSHGFTAYGNEILRSGKWGKQKGWGSANNFSKENAYEVGGVRVQSFSDYVPNMFFDYMQMFADMSARELPSHAYTKEQTYVKLFGMTGQRINMSLIFKGANLTEEQQKRYDELAKKGIEAIKKDPEFKAMAEHAGLDEKGNYIYEDESFPADVAYKLRKDPRYKNVGTIAVGLSDAHIRKLLADPQIDMVIPYHSSGVSQIIKVARNLALYTDYTDSQNTRNADGKKIKKGTDYDWYAHIASEINPDGMTLRETVDDYLAWCDENNYLPVFDQFRNEEGYWKLLVDFRSYDNDGNFMPQGRVTMTFPDNFEKIVKESLAEQQKTEDLMEAEMSSEQDTLYTEVKEFLGQSGAIKYSVSVDSEGTQLTEDQAEYFKDSKIVDENGNLKVMYHGTTEEFYTFDPKKFGGKNGTAEGYGIYLTDDTAVSDAYGNRTLKGYANVTHPAYSNKKTISEKDLAKLIKMTCEIEAERIMADEGYDSIEDAIRDTWVSNISNTYDKTMDEAYLDASRQYLKLNSNDMDIIQVMMNDQGIRGFESAYDFYEILTDTLGIDGFVTDWADKTGNESQVVVVFDSNQFKNADNLHPTESEDIRYSVKIEEVPKDDRPSAFEMASFYRAVSNYNDGNGNDVYTKTDDGYVIIPLSTGNPNLIDNKFVYADPNNLQPSIEKLVVIHAQSGDEAAEIIKNFEMGAINNEDYERTKQAIRNIYGEEILTDYVASSERDNEESVGRREGKEVIRNNEDDSELQDRKGSNVSPGKQKSIKVDNRNHKLSAAQIKYFKNSKIVDEDGRLKVMYHGTNEANFTIFDPKYSDDEASLFFTDSRFVASSYAGTEDAIDPYDLRTKDKVKTIDDLKKRFEDTTFGVREEDGDIIIEDIEDPDDVFELIRESTVAEAYQEWIDQFSWNGEEGEFGGLYEVYLNITNPLVIEGNESNWEEIYPEEIIDEDADLYDKIQVIKKNDDGTVKIEWALSGGNGGAVENMTDEQFREKFGDDLYKKFIEQNRYLWKENVYINPGGELIPTDTRGLSEYARKHGYDGLVLNNLVDIGEYGKYAEAAQIVVAFNSDQIKSIDNKKPTSDPDIRYSVKVDSEGKELTKDQIKYFKDSKVVDAEGNLMVMYHGSSSADKFTIFEDRGSVNGRMLGDGFYFTPDKKAAKSWSRTEKPNIYKAYLNITKPLYISDNIKVSQDMIDYALMRQQMIIDDAKNNPDEYYGRADIVIENTERMMSEIPDWSTATFSTWYGKDFIGVGDYDGYILIASENHDFYAAYGDQYVVFNPSQIKKTTNKKPTADPDIRYSVTVDSDGTKLTEGQQRYFNNSKNLAADGSLVVMYHGSNAGGFTLFDPKKADDGISLFFTDNPRVADTYVRRYGLDRPMDRVIYKSNIKAIKDFDTARAFLEEKGYTNFSSDGGKYPRWSFNDLTGHRIYGWSQKDVIGEANSLRQGRKGLYEVYLNIENPYIIDAKGNTWNDLTNMAYPDDWDVIPEGYDDYDELDLTISKAFGDAYDVESFGKDFYETMTIDEIERDFGSQIANSVRKNGGVKYRSILFNQETKEVIPNTTRAAARFAKDNGYDGVIIKNVQDNGQFHKASDWGQTSNIAIVFSPDQVKDVNNLNPTSSKDIRYSIKLDDDPFMDFDNYGTSEDAKAVNILMEGMEALKNTEVDEGKIRQIANKLRKEYGSSYNINELTDRLVKAFAYMQTEDHVDYKTMMGILKDIARPVIEASTEVEGKEDYKAFVNAFKGYKIKLTDRQKAEVKHSLGSYGAYCRAMMPITISDNGTMTLDQLWDELVEKSGYMLDRDATEGDMPLNLLDTLQTIRPTTRNTYGGDIEDVSKDLAMRIVEEYVGGEVSDKMRKQIADYRAKLKKDYDERLKKYEGRANARLLARNKKKAEQAEERQKVRDLRHAIKIDAKKLMHWIEKPTEGKSVPHNMVMPIMEFLSAFDFVDPDIVMKEDGRWHVKVFDRLDRQNGKKKFVYKDISGATRDEALAKFNEAIGRGEGSKEQRFWAQRMSDIRDIYDRVQKDEDFEDNEMNEFLRTLDGDGLADDLNTILSKNKDSVNMNHLSSAELSVLNNIIKNIFHAVNQGNKAYTMSEDLAQMGRDTIKDAEGKEVKSRNKFLEGLYRTLRIDNSTPRTFFKLLGSRGIDAYKSLRNGLNTEILDLKKASEFMEGMMEGIDKKEVAKWTGTSAVIHEFALSGGTLRMTDDQIMGLYLTIRRNGGRDRIAGGIRPSTIRTKGVPIRQKAMHLTDSDIAKIESVLTPQQIELAKKMQKYMAEECAKMGNETSRQMYGFNKFLDPTYYPWTVDKNTVPSRNTSEDVPMYTSIKNSGFTKALKPEANNPLVIKGIFDVFTEHVAGMATYHGYAASIQDVMRWLNYKTVTDEEGNYKTHTTVKEAVDVLAGGAEGDGVRYIQNLILDINQANRSRYVGNFTDALIGNYKAAAVGANLRVVIQQPTAYFRALNMIDSKYLFAVNPKQAMKYIKISQEECPISWWKAKGYYETNLGQPLKEIVTGIASPMEALKDKLMAPAGLADDATWGFLYAAVEKEQRDKLRGKGLSEEEFRKAVNDRFDEMVDNTQVVDSTLHRSQYMRSTDRLNKIQTAFMAEPTKSYNMVMEALVEDLRDKSYKKTARAVSAFLIAALATSAAQSLMDSLRKNGDDDDWWEKFMGYVKDNFLDNINPFNLLPVVKDIAPDLFNAFTGESTFGKSTSRFDIDALSSVSDAVSAWMKFAQGNGNKTPYGMIMATIKPISQVTGIPLYNLTRDAVSLYNAFFENIETTMKKGNTAKNEQKKEVVSVVDKEKSEDTIRETITQAVEHGVSIYDLKGGITSEYKNKYFDAYSEGDMEKAKEIANKAAGGFAVMGLSDEEIDEIINGWQEEAITYSALDRAIADGKDIEKEIAHVQEGKKDEKIVEHIMNRFASTVKYEDANNTESEWRENVEKALQAIDATYTFDTVLEEAETKAAEKAEEAAVEAKHKEMKDNFFDAVDKKDGSAGRKALQVMKDEGIEAKTVKSAVSTKYHDMWKEAKTQAEKDKAKADWKSAYTLVNNVYGSSSNNLDQTWSEWEKKQSE